MPCYRIIDDDGVVVPGASVPEVFEESRELSVRMQTTMILVSEFDKVFNEAQRQGRLSFYFTNRGEEACSVGSGAALHDHDWVWPQYRELGATFWRGVSFGRRSKPVLPQQIRSDKGRQLPMHIGSPERRLMYVKSNLGQQVARRDGRRVRDEAARSWRPIAGARANCGSVGPPATGAPHGTHHHAP